MSIVIRFPVRAKRTHTVPAAPGLSMLTTPAPVTVAGDVSLVKLIRALHTEGLTLSYDPASRIMVIQRRKAEG